MPEATRPTLTPTHWLVVTRVAAGESNAAIAVELGLAPKTVRNHVTRIARQVPRDPALTERAARHLWYQRVGHAYHEEARRDA